MEISQAKIKRPNRPMNGENSQVVQLDASTMQAMLENAPINVMLADLKGTVVYLNQASKDTLLQIEDQLPVAVNEIIGGSYDVFHKVPSHQRKLLASEKNLPHRAIIQVGKEKLDLLVTASLDAEGNYIGPMVPWSHGR